MNKRPALLVTLVACFFVQPASLLADSPPVTQEIRYHMPEAGEVFLVWGVDGWGAVPEEIRPARTTVEDGVMYTPMARQGDTFVVEVQVPSGTALDYGFQIRSTRRGSAISWVWDGDYRAAPSEDGVIEVTSDLKLIVTQEIRYHMPEAGEVFLVWGVNGWAVVPEEIRPRRTAVRENLMYTPMARQGDAFIVKVQVPAGATIDYVFQITRARGGAAIEVWDTNGAPKQDYHTAAVHGGVAELRASLSIVKQAVAGGVGIGGLSDIGLMLLAGVCLFVVADVGYRHLAVEGSTKCLLIRVQTALWGRRLPLSMIFISALYLSAINTIPYLWGDNIHYMIVGRSIATGQGFKSIHLPGSPPFGFPIPMFPMLLAPFIRFFGYSLLPMKVFVAVTGVVAIYLVFYLFRSQTDAPQVILLMLFVGVSPQIVSFSHQVMSEVPYLVFSLLSLICLGKYASEEKWFTRTGFIGAMVITGACLTKSVGISLILAAVPYLLWDSPANKFESLKKVGLLVLISTVLCLLMNYPTLGHIPYVGQFARQSPYTSDTASANLGDLVARILANVKAYWKAVPEAVLYRTYKTPSIFFAGVSFILLGYGLIHSLVKRRTCIEYYVLFYTAILLLYEPINYGNVQRYVVPMIPFILYYFVRGIEQIGLRISRFRHTQDAGVSFVTAKNHNGSSLPWPAASSPRLAHIVSMAVICMLILFNLSSTVQASVLRTQPEMFDYYVLDNENWVGFERMAVWAREHIPSESTVVTRMDLFFHFWSHRLVTWYPYVDPQADREQVLQAILATNAEYIALDSLIKDRTAEQQTIMHTVLQSPDAFRLVYQDRDNRIYQVLPEARLSQRQ